MVRVLFRVGGGGALSYFGSYLKNGWVWGGWMGIHPQPFYPTATFSQPSLNLESLNIIISILDQPTKFYLMQYQQNTRTNNQH